MKYLALFSLLFLMSFSLYAKKERNSRANKFICEPHSYVPFLPPTSCQEHNWVELGEERRCFNSGHSVLEKHQCHERSLISLFDPQVDGYYQTDQSHFSTIE